MKKTKGLVASSVGLALGLAGAIALPIAPSGCAGDPQDSCTICASLGMATWACYGGLSSSARRYKGTVCYAAWGAAHQIEAECQAAYGTPTWWVNKATLVPCDDYAADTGGFDGTGYPPPSANCSNWNPSSKVSFQSGVYYVEGLFFESLVDDSAPLSVCDGARVEDTGSGWVVTGATSGTLLHALGLQNGDEIVSINGFGLSSLGRAATALGIEWMENLESQYTLTVKRSGNNITLDYELWWPTFSE